MSGSLYLKCYPPTGYTTTITGALSAAQTIKIENDTTTNLTQSAGGKLSAGTGVFQIGASSTNFDLSVSENEFSTVAIKTGNGNNSVVNKFKNKKASNVTFAAHSSGSQIEFTETEGSIIVDAVADAITNFGAIDGITTNGGSLVLTSNANIILKKDVYTASTATTGTYGSMTFDGFVQLDKPGGTINIGSASGGSNRVMHFKKTISSAGSTMTSADISGHIIQFDDTVSNITKLTINHDASGYVTTAATSLAFTNIDEILLSAFTFTEGGKDLVFRTSKLTGNPKITANNISYLPQGTGNMHYAGTLPAPVINDNYFQAFTSNTSAPPYVSAQKITLGEAGYTTGNINIYTVAGAEIHHEFITGQDDIVSSSVKTVEFHDNFNSGITPKDITVKANAIYFRGGAIYVRDFNAYVRQQAQLMPVTGTSTPTSTTITAGRNILFDGVTLSSVKKGGDLDRNISQDLTLIAGERIDIYGNVKNDIALTLNGQTITMGTAAAAVAATDISELKSLTITHTGIAANHNVTIKSSLALQGALTHTNNDPTPKIIISPGAAITSEDGNISFTNEINCAGPLTIATTAKTAARTITIKQITVNTAGDAALTLRAANFSSYLGTVILQGNVVVNPAAAVPNALTIEAGSLTIASTVSQISTTNGNIKFAVNGLTIAGSPTITATTAYGFQITPLTLTKTVAYGDNVSGASEDVKYAATWSGITAGYFIVGDAAHNAAISIYTVTNTNAAVEFRSLQKLSFKGGYSSNNKNLTCSTGSIAFPSAPTAIHLGSGDLIANKNITSEYTGPQGITLTANNITLGAVNPGGAATTNQTKLLIDVTTSLILNGDISARGGFEVNDSAPSPSGDVTINGNVIQTSDTNIKLIVSAITVSSGPANLSINAASTLGTVPKITLTSSINANGRTINLSAGATGTIVFDGTSALLLDNANKVVLTGKVELNNMSGLSITAGNDVEFLGDVALSGNLTITGNNVTFNKSITDDSTITAVPTPASSAPVWPGTSPASGKKLDVTASGTLSIENIYLGSFYQRGTGGLHVGKQNGLLSQTTTLATRAATTFFVAGDLILYSDTIIYDGSPKTLFGGGIFSEPNKNWSLTIRNINSSSEIEFSGNLGNNTTQRLGTVILDAMKISHAVNTTQLGVFAENIEFKKTAEAVTLASNRVINCSLLLDALTGASNGAITVTDKETVHSGNLILQHGTMDIEASYTLGNSASVTKGFIVSEFACTLDASTELIIQSSSTAVNFIVAPNPGAALYAHPLSTVKLVNNASPGEITISNPATYKLGSVELAGSSTVSAGSDLVVQGDWTEPQNTTQYFDPQNYSVRFTGSATHQIVTITGNTVWNKFLVDNNLSDSYISTLKFSNYNTTGDTHTFNDITVRGTPANPIELNCINSVSPSYIIPPMAPTTEFWVLTVSSSGGSYLFEHITVYHSYAENAITASPVLVTTGAIAPYWSVNWNTQFYFIFSFSEDSDGDGRIDRIRIQATSPMSTAAPALITTASGSPIPTGLKIEVNGYAVKSYELGGTAALGGWPFLYVNLEQKTQADTDARPTWKLINSGDVIDVISGLQFGIPDAFKNGFPTVDTAPPRILYSLANPNGQLYIRFSEVLAGTAPGTISESSVSPPFTFSSTTINGNSLTAQLSSGGTTAALVLNDARYDIASLATLTGSEQNDWPSYPAELSARIRPSYPVDADYSSYTEIDIFSSSFPGTLPTLSSLYDSAGKMKVQDSPTAAAPWTTQRRVSDLLILAQPASAAALTDSFWPSSAVNLASNPGAPNSLVNQWDGSQTLLLSRDWSTKAIFAELSLEVQNQSALSTPPLLLYGHDVSSQFRGNGLWLPSSGITDSRYDPLCNFVPNFYNPSNIAGTMLSTGFNYDLDAQGLGSKNVFEFIFKINSAAPALYAVRLDSTAPVWWEGLRTFAFNLRDLERQRGGVSIMDNVINPITGGVTRLSYVLARPGQVTINIFGMDGNIIRTLYRGSRDAGEHFAEWDGRNGSGKAVARGIYFVRIVGPDLDEMRKIMVVK
ncbi:MAG: hypothetical protein LBD22_01665 [Spirochaetaceae bacterium]|nr:hypothetical protein [Spirochaetaceae bacterium]